MEAQHFADLALSDDCDTSESLTIIMKEVGDVYFMYLGSKLDQFQFFQSMMIGFVWLVGWMSSKLLHMAEEMAPAGLTTTGI